MSVEQLAAALQQYVIVGMAGCQPSAAMRDEAIGLLAEVQNSTAEAVRRDFLFRADGYARSNQRIDSQKRAAETGPAPRMRPQA